MSENMITHIEAPKGWQILNLKELTGYRDLFFFLVWRDIKVLYAQTILGFTWAILQPTVQIVIFTVIFGKVAKLDTDGIPYALFSSVAIIPWTYITQSMSQSSQSMVAGQHMLSKVYFPRLIFPLAPLLSNLVSFCISLSVLLCLFIYYQVLPTWNILMLPFCLIYMVCISAGFGMWLSALAIRFRDVKHAMPFAIRMLMYTAPVVYSASSLSEKYRLLYSLNPLVGVIEGYRASLLGTPIPWMYMVPGIFTTLLILISGAYYFKRMERVFVDVI
jgi:lipopolysaccharide transport system permease protein